MHEPQLPPAECRVMHEPQLPPADKGDPTSDGARRRLLWQTVEAFFIKLARIGGEIRGEARGNLRFGLVLAKQKN